MTKPEPFLLQPAGKDYLWGGNRLHTLFGKQLPLHPLAETWECSTHPDGCSIVASGIDKGKTLAEVLQQHPEFLGTKTSATGDLPVLIKLIDAAKDLSVQVHPDDAYAQQYEHEPNGKTEMWYILEAEPGASLIYGFSKPMQPEQLDTCLKENTILSYLQKIPVKKGDVFLIPAGTVHAIGAGIVLAEIQQRSFFSGCIRTIVIIEPIGEVGTLLNFCQYNACSNGVYCSSRYQKYISLFHRDFLKIRQNRTDATGKKRPLHVEKAKAVIQFSANQPPQMKQPMQQKNGYRVQCLCKCPYFCTTLLTIQTACDWTNYQPDSDTFQVLLCISGSGTMQTKENALSFQKGDCIFLPAHSSMERLTGTAELLQITG